MPEDILAFPIQPLPLPLLSSSETYLPTDLVELVDLVEEEHAREHKVQILILRPVLDRCTDRL